MTQEKRLKLVLTRAYRALYNARYKSTESLQIMNEIAPVIGQAQREIKWVDGYGYDYIVRHEVHTHD